MYIRKLFSLSLLLALSGTSPLSKRSISAGPVISTNFPDPGWIENDGKYYAFSTQSGGLHIPTASSPDFKTWSVIAGHDALPNVGPWSNGQRVWAPDVVKLPSGKFVLYYAADNKAGKHCIGTATSSSPEGPYSPTANPLACDDALGGLIDPAGFQDADGKHYVVYKVDENSIGHGGNCNNGNPPIVPTPIRLQEVQADGVTPVGEPQEILNRSDADGPLVEAPSLVRVADPTSAGGWLYILFFSSNCYAGGLYDTSYAWSANGIRNGGKDYTKAGKPLLVTGTPDGAGGKLYSPGGLDVGPGGLNVLFHADKATSASVRPLWAGQIKIDVAKRLVTI